MNLDRNKIRQNRFIIPLRKAIWNYYEGLIKTLLSRIILILFENFRKTHSSYFENEKWPDSPRVSTLAFMELYLGKYQNINRSWEAKRTGNYVCIEHTTERGIKYKCDTAFRVDDKF